MYKIISYEENDAYPDSFGYFETAFMIQQLDFPNYLIEYWDLDNEEIQITWNPEWENKGDRKDEQ